MKEMSVLVTGAPGRIPAPPHSKDTGTRALPQTPNLGALRCFFSDPRTVRDGRLLSPSHPGDGISVGAAEQPKTAGASAHIALFISGRTGP